MRVIATEEHRGTPDVVARGDGSIPAGHPD